MLSNRGYVYRGERLSELEGLYFFGDYCTGNVWSLEVANGMADNYNQWNLESYKDGINISSFGQDGKGELYIVNHNGEIYKIVDVK